MPEPFASQYGGAASGLLLGSQIGNNIINAYRQGQEMREGEIKQQNDEETRQLQNATLLSALIAQRYKHITNPQELKRLMAAAYDKAGKQYNSPILKMLAEQTIQEDDASLVEKTKFFAEIGEAVKAGNTNFFADPAIMQKVKDYGLPDESMQLSYQVTEINRKEKQGTADLEGLRTSAGAAAGIPPVNFREADITQPEEPVNLGLSSGNINTPYLSLLNRDTNISPMGRTGGLLTNKLKASIPLAMPRNLTPEQTRNEKIIGTADTNVLQDFIKARTALPKEGEVTVKERRVDDYRQEREQYLSLVKKRNDMLAGTDISAISYGKEGYNKAIKDLEDKIEKVGGGLKKRYPEFYKQDFSDSEEITGKEAVSSGAAGYIKKALKGKK